MHIHACAFVFVCVDIPAELYVHSTVMGIEMTYAA